MSALFSTLVQDAHSEHWNEATLSKLSRAELRGLARLFGAPDGDAKSGLVIRILAHRQLRLRLNRFTNDPADLAVAYRKESLRSMCREAGLWKSGNKRQLAAALLNWRNRCRAHGQRFLAELREEARTRSTQLNLF